MTGRTPEPGIVYRLVAFSTRAKARISKRPAYAGWEPVPTSPENALGEDPHDTSSHAEVCAAAVVGARRREHCIRGRTAGRTGDRRDHRHGAVARTRPAGHTDLHSRRVGR